jgi:predicted DNA-binding transcriptional regulator AlpA
MTPPVPAPSLDELARNPAQAARLSLEIRQALTLQCAAVLAALAVPMSVGDGHRPATSLEADQLLTPEAAAQQLGVSPRWLYRHAAKLPFTRRLSRKVLRFSETGLRRWQATRRA